MRGSVSNVAIVLACALAAASATTSAHAQTPQEHEQARAMLAEGRTMRAAGDLRGALDRFRAAHEIEHLPTTGFEVGKTLVALGRLVEARELLSEIAKAPPSEGEPPPLASARSDARDLVDALERRIPTLTLKLSAPAAAGVAALVDGFPVAMELLTKPRRMDPGEHVVVLRSASATTEKLVTLAEGESRELVVDPPRAAEEPAAATAPRPVGPPPPPAPEPRSYTLTWVGAGVGVVAAGLGIATGLVASSKKSDLEPRCPDMSCPPDVHDELRGAKTIALVSTISFVVVGVSAALVVYDLLRSPSASRSAPGATGAARPRLGLTF